jgi:hypothetical protein
LLQYELDFFYGYVGIPEFFSSYVGFFYGGHAAKSGKLPVLTAFLFHSYVGSHRLKFLNFHFTSHKQIA